MGIIFRGFLIKSSVNVPVSTENVSYSELLMPDECVRESFTVYDSSEFVKLIFFPAIKNDVIDQIIIIHCHRTSHEYRVGCSKTISAKMNDIGYPAGCAHLKRRSLPNVKAVFGFFANT